MWEKTILDTEICKRQVLPITAHHEHMPVSDYMGEADSWQNVKGKAWAQYAD